MKYLKRFYWWCWYQLYSRRVTYGVQWYWADTYRLRQEIADRVFFRRSSAEAFWNDIADKVKPDQIAALWLIDQADYKQVIESINY